MGVRDELAGVAVDGVAPVVGRRGLDLSGSLSVLTELGLESAVDVIPPGRECVNAILAEAETIEGVSYWSYITEN